ncbi:MAG: peptide chain release factor H [Cloacibacterium sp.]
MKQIIQITSGKGPVECEFFVQETFNLMKKEIEILKLDYKVVEMIEGEVSGFQSITFEVEENPEFLNSWIGSIQFIGKSKFRPHHQRKNWFIGVFEIENFFELEIHEKELEFQTMRSSGNGGQNVNKVNSAVRVTHLPTKIQVVAMDSRSQLENKKIAVQRLKLKILEINAKKSSAQKQNQWMNHLQLERGNPKKIFKM